MKQLKLVVASMTMLGLISAPAIAAAQTQHNKRVHRVTHVAQTRDYKSLGALDVAPVMESARIDISQTIYDAGSQNLGRAKPMPDWFNRVGVSGGVNFDAAWGNRGQGYEGENTRRISLNDAYLNTSATVNDWTRAFASLSFNSASSRITTAATLPAVLNGQYSDVYNAPNTINLEQGFITIANYDASPLFLQVGKQFQDFGRYSIHPMTYSLTQVLSESLQTSAKLGFITRMGLHGSASVFDNPARQIGTNHTKTVYGLALGFAQPNEVLGFDVGIGYMSQLTGANDVAQALGNAMINKMTYVHTVGGIAVYGDVNSGPFSLAARYTTAIQSFSPNDISTQYGLSANTLSGARPWAADLTAGYGFNGMGKNQNVYVGYQTSNDAVNLAIPKNRWLIGYNIDMWRNTNLGVEVARDQAYSSGNLGSGRSTNIIHARAGVKFG